MPNLLRIWAYRLDGSGVADIALRTQLRDAVRALAHSGRHSHVEFKRELDDLAPRIPGAAVNFLATDANFFWTIWTIREGQREVEWLGLCAADGITIRPPVAPLLRRPVSVADPARAAVLRAELAELADHDPSIDGDGSIVFPRDWSDAERLQRGAEVFAPHASDGLEAIALLKGETAADAVRLVRWRAGRPDILPVVPLADEPEDAINATFLWTHARVERGVW